MRSRSSKYSLLSLLMVLAAGSTHAGLFSSEQVVPAEEKQRPEGNKELPKPQQINAEFQDVPVIKCWQEGSLLFEEKYWRPDGKLPGTELKSRNGASLQLMPFGDTFCFYRDGNGRR